MPDEDRTFNGSLVLNLRIWWRHMHTLYKDFHEKWYLKILSKLHEPLGQDNLK